MINFPLRPTTHKSSVLITLSALIISLAVCAVTQTYAQTGAKKRIANDVKQVLSKMPWTATCCSEFQDSAAAPPTRGITASMVSSQAVRQALVTRMQSDKHYEKLDAASRQEVYQRIAACLNQKFDNYIVFSFSYGFADFLNSSLTSPDQIHLPTSDGTKIAGRLVPEASSIEVKCGWLPDEIKFLGGAGGQLRNEIAFPRTVDGKPAVTSADKSIRVVVDLNKTYLSPASAGELNFDVAKLVYQGKPDY